MALDTLYVAFQAFNNPVAMAQSLSLAFPSKRLKLLHGN